MRLSDAKVKAVTLPIEKKQLKLSDGVEGYTFNFQKLGNTGE